MLSKILDVLADPKDGSPLALSSDGVRSQSGDFFPVDPTGYLDLSMGKTPCEDGDDPGMIASREAFLSMGHFAPFVEAVSTGVHDA